MLKQNLASFDIHVGQGMVHDGLSLGIEEMEIRCCFNQIRQGICVKSPVHHLHDWSYAIKISGVKVYPLLLKEFENIHPIANSPCASNRRMGSIFPNSVDVFGIHSLLQQRFQHVYSSALASIQPSIAAFVICICQRKSVGLEISNHLFIDDERCHQMQGVCAVVIAFDRWVSSL